MIKLGNVKLGKIGIGTDRPALKVKNIAKLGKNIVKVLDNRISRKDKKRLSNKINNLNTNGAKNSLQGLKSFNTLINNVKKFNVNTRDLDIGYSQKTLASMVKEYERVSKRTKIASKTERLIRNGKIPRVKGNAIIAKHLEIASNELKSLNRKYASKEYDDTGKLKRNVENSFINQLSNELNVRTKIFNVGKIFDIVKKGKDNEKNIIIKTADGLGSKYKHLQIQNEADNYKLNPSYLEKIKIRTKASFNVININTQEIDNQIKIEKEHRDKSVNLLMLESLKKSIDNHYTEIAHEIGFGTLHYALCSGSSFGIGLDVLNKFRWFSFNANGAFTKILQEFFIQPMICANK